VTVPRESGLNRKVIELLQTIDEMNDLRDSLEPLSSDADPPIPSTSLQPPTAADPTFSPFSKTVLQIHHFFQGQFDVALILQAIHACAGDYRRAVVKLAEGFSGCNLLEMPPTDEFSKGSLRRYIEGRSAPSESGRLTIAKTVSQQVAEKDRTWKRSRCVARNRTLCLEAVSHRAEKTVSKALALHDFVSCGTHHCMHN
jgi:hypothetical protein